MVMLQAIDKTGSNGKHGVVFPHHPESPGGGADADESEETDNLDEALEDQAKREGSLGWWDYLIKSGRSLTYGRKHIELGEPVLVIEARKRAHEMAAAAAQAAVKAAAGGAGEGAGEREEVSAEDYDRLARIFGALSGGTLPRAWTPQSAASAIQVGTLHACCIMMEITQRTGIGPGPFHTHPIYLICCTQVGFHT